MRVLPALVAFVFAAAAFGEGPRYYYPLPKADPPERLEADVAVYGATPAGVTAAIQAARMGKKAILFEFGRHVGGMTSSGLSKTDGGKHAAGIATEFYGAVGKANFTPAAAEGQFRKMLADAKVRLLTEHRLAEVSKEGQRITGLSFENGTSVKAAMFIDATYEGDLLAGAKVSYTVGREANSVYSETLNGVQQRGGHDFKYAVDPYRTAGDAQSGLLAGISSEPLGETGAGDKSVQAYNFRMFLSKGEDRIAFPKPAHYDPERYALLARYIAAGAQIGQFMQLREGDSNNQGGFSTDYIGGSKDWPEADYATRERIYQDHVSYQQGLMYFLTHDERVPAEMREKIGAFGLAPGMFAESGDWPHQLYVREGRRMVSDYVMTERHCRGQVVAEDSVGLAEYNMDSHNCRRLVVGGRVRNEGDVQVAPAGPYPVSYRAIRPREEECGNLLVPVCLSASHIAYGSIRMEPVFMVLGQSAGTAAGLALDAGSSVQRVPYGKLRARLLADHQLLSVPAKGSSGGGGGSAGAAATGAAAGGAATTAK